MDIIGNGSFEKILNDRDGIRFFAAGVSDSSYDGGIAPVMIEAARIGIESGLAKVYNEMFVYFSTISVFLKQTPYTNHKLTMENCVKNNCENYTIIRLGNVWECTNPNTFINAYKSKPYEPRDEWKYMISKEQLNFITNNLPRTGKHEISIFGEMLKAAQCIKNTEHLSK
jgi:hypothetical protein